MNIIDLGLIEYDKALQIQLETLERVIAKEENNTLFLLEHYPVITLGRNGGLENLLVDSTLLAQKGVRVVKASRGGNITCHFPGQLVFYPIFKLERKKGGIKRFFYELEEVVIQVLKKYEISAARIENKAGVFVAGKKIASMGIGVRKWVSYHGVALNLVNDLSLFEFINPCGLNGIEMTSIHRERGDLYPDMSKLKEDIVHEFRKTIASA
ncbi:lipoyl(octanoyl) transferase LipB [Desulfovulcanus sp.]